MQGVSQQTIEILASSWRDGTRTQYRSYIEGWCTFFERLQYDSFRPSVANILDFLTMLYDECSLGYSALNTARSALSTFIVVEGVPVGQHHLVKRFMRGVFNLRPALPRYALMWDANIILKYVKAESRF